MTKYYRVTKEQLPVLKWLRANGVRGIDWEFSGGYKAIEVRFMNDKLELAYIMRYEWQHS
jgi:hypothetical protein